jgi:hypothetical protein
MAANAIFNSAMMTPACFYDCGYFVWCSSDVVAPVLSGGRCGRNFLFFQILPIALLIRVHDHDNNEKELTEKACSIFKATKFVKLDTYIPLGMTGTSEKRSKHTVINSSCTTNLATLQIFSVLSMRAWSRLGRQLRIRMHMAGLCEVGSETQSLHRWQQPQMRGRHTSKLNSHYPFPSYCVPREMRLYLDRERRGERLYRPCITLGCAVVYCSCNAILILTLSLCVVRYT